MKKQYRIAWKSLLTGYGGVGEWFNASELEALKNRIVEAERKHPYITHTIETRTVG